MKLLILANDTDVVVLAISNFDEIGAHELWIGFGVGKHFHYIPIHEIVKKMSSEMRKALPAFHALTGCDTTSFFSGSGKKSAYEKWLARPELTTALCHIMDRPDKLEEEYIDIISKYVIALYSVTCPLSDVNRARQYIFTHGARTFEYLPPTNETLREHIFFCFRNVLSDFLNQDVP